MDVDLGAINTASGLRKRALAKRDAGRHDAAIQDLQESVKRLESFSLLSPGEFGRVYYDLAANKLAIGNYDDAMKYFAKALADPPMIDTRIGPVMSSIIAKWGSDYAMHLGMVGDVAKAEDYYYLAADRLRAYETYDVTRDWRIYGDYYKSCLVAARASIFEANGRHADAETLWREALELNAGKWSGKDQFVRGNIMEQYIKTLSLLGRNLRLQGRLSEGEAAAQAAVVTAIELFGSHTAHTLRALGEMREQLVAQDRLDDADAINIASLRIFPLVGIGPESLTWALSVRAMGEIALLKGRWADAATAYRDLDQFSTSNPQGYDAYFAHDPGRAMARAFNGDLATAQEVLERQMAVISVRKGEKSIETAEIRGLLAVVRGRSGDLIEAERLFHLSVPVLLEAQTQSGRSAVAMARMRWIAEGMLDLIRDRRVGAEALSDLSFRAVELARAGAVQRTISKGAARLGSGQSELAQLVRRQQDAAMEISSFREALLFASAAGTGTRALRGDLEGQVSVRTATIDATEKEIAEKFPTYQQLISPRLPSIDSVTATLRPGQAAVTIYSGDELTAVWSFSKGQPMSFATVPVGRAEISRLVAAVRQSTEIAGDTLDSIPAFDMAAAYRLYQLLLEPVKEGWTDAKSLVIVPDGPLGFLPFALLPTEAPKPLADKAAVFDRYRQVKWLGRSHAISTVPSAASLVSLRQMQAARSDRRPFVGFGDPVFSGSASPQNVAQVTARGAIHQRNARVTDLGSLDDSGILSSRLSNLVPLPETADEVREVARAIGADEAQDVFLGRAATLEAVKSTPLADRKVVMFATHGLVAGDLDGLNQPALALSNPAVVGGPGDGLLKMEDVLGLTLDADWVVLSACNTAAADGAGAEAVSGLGRAFFYAGTRAVLATHWAVETGSAQQITTELFRRQAANQNLSRAEALRQAMVAVMDGAGIIENGKTVATFAHPVFWAPFALVGDGG